MNPTSLSIRARRAGFRILVVPAALIRKHASWAHWIIVVPNFLARWIGFFVAFAITRRCPKLIQALARGVLDFATRRMGDRSCS